MIASQDMATAGSSRRRGPTLPGLLRGAALAALALWLVGPLVPILVWSFAYRWTLPDLLPRHLHWRVGTVVCGIPLVLLPLSRQRDLIEAIEHVAPGRGFLHFSYCATSPLPSGKLGLSGRRQSWTPLNFPPASVWRYVSVDRAEKSEPGA